MGLLDKEVVELLVVEAKLAAVEPYEERSLWSLWLYFGQMGGAVVDDEIDVALDVA